MTRDEYEAAICKNLPESRLVDFKKVQGKGWRPEESRCHFNVDRWVQENPGHTPVRGWVVYKPSFANGKLGLELTAHSVVRDEKGELFDITPIRDNRQRPSMRFVPHIGDADSFWEFEKANRFICCPNCA